MLLISFTALSLWRNDSRLVLDCNNRPLLKRICVVQRVFKWWAIVVFTVHSCASKKRKRDTHWKPSAPPHYWLCSFSFAVFFIINRYDKSIKRRVKHMSAFGFFPTAQLETRIRRSEDRNGWKYGEYDSKGSDCKNASSACKMCLDAHCYFICLVHIHKWCLVKD